GPRLLRGAGPQRIHAGPRRARPAAPLRRTRPEDRPPAGQLLPGPNDPPDYRPEPDGALAQATLLLPLPQRTRRHRLLQPPPQPRRGTGASGRAVTAPSLLIENKSPPHPKAHPLPRVGFPWNKKTTV